MSDMEKQVAQRNQYYWKKNACPARSAFEKDCICWHDEGTGPWHGAEPGPESGLTWRTVCAEPAQAPAGELSKLTDMDTKSVTQLAALIEKEREELKQLEALYESMDLTGTQNEIYRTIMLRAEKVVAGIIEQQKGKIAALAEKMRIEVSK